MTTSSGGCVAPAPGPAPLGVDGVLSALRLMLARSGADERQCFEMLRRWGAQRRITPQQRVILPEDVKAAIARFTAKPPEAVGKPLRAEGGALQPPRTDGAPMGPPAEGEELAKRQPPRTEGAEPEARKQPPAGGEELVKRQPPRTEGAEPEARKQPLAEGEELAKRKPPRTDGEELVKRKRSRTEGEELAKRKPPRTEGEELKPPRTEAEELEERRHRAAPYVGLSLEEMRERRMREVLREMDERLRESVVRTSRALGHEPSEEALAAIQGDGAERRDAYLRAIHTVREAISMPEGLVAELMPHQIDGLEWLVSVYANGLHGILADEMGLGKTVQTIAWLQWLKEFKGNKGPHLIVAPKSTLTNWEAEFKRFAPTYKAWLVVGTEEERSAFAKKLRKRVKHNKTTAFITNYEQIHRNDWLQDFDWQAIIIDEGHRMKNKDSVLHQTMTRMRCRTRMLLTGTPLQNNMSELWALLHYLMPDLWATTLDFQAWFLDPLSGVEGLNEFEVQLRPEDEQLLISKLHLMLSPFLLQRTKAQVMEQRLPPKVEATVRVPLSAWQGRAYKDLEKRTIRLLSSTDKVETASVNNALMQLRKIVLHPYLFGHRGPSPDLFRASGKVEVLDRMLTKLVRFGHKTLIFSQFTSVLDVLGAYLEWRGWSFARLDGQTPHEERRRQISAFSACDAGLTVFLLSARAGGLGLNLQAADTVILFDLDWNPQNDKQAIARAHRYGQRKEVRVFRLLTDSPVERHMERRCNEKLDLERKIMGAGMFSKGASHEQRAELLRSILGVKADAAAAEDTAQSGPAAPLPPTADEETTSPETLNKMLARSDEEFVSFQEIDAELLRPQDSSVTDSSLPVLVRAGRLMREEEVPEGFRLSDEAESDS